MKLTIWQVCPCGEHVALIYAPTNTPATTENSHIVFVRKPDFDRAFGAIINARMQDVIDELGINYPHA